jgi:glucose/arabinose dehydrogenase
MLPLMLAALTACNDGATAPKTGSLAVNVDGLPAGVQPSVTVTGPNAYRRTLTSSSTLEALPEGTYTVVALDITAGGDRFASTPATQTVEVSDGAVTTRGLTYAVATARLTVTVLGLPTGTPARINISGPGGFTRAVDATTSLTLLAPGDYTVSASNVEAAGKTYRAAPPPGTQIVSLSPSRTPVAIALDYGAGNGSLDVSIIGLPAETNASVTVTGPAGYTRALTASAALRYLEPGTYTLSAASVASNLTTHAPSPASTTSDVNDAVVRSATVTYGSMALQLRLQLVADGLTEPVFLTAPDGDARQFVVERNGRIRIVQRDTLLAMPFLDIRDRVNFIGERGMLSMAFDPQYATNGFVYAYYVNLLGSVTVERFSSTPGSNVASASAGIVLTIPHGGSEHHGGLIAFGPDGMFYLAPGDGGCCGDPQNNAQNLGTLLGKMLRIDVRTVPYTIPADNPFVTRSGARAEIWAYGLRNPWRFSFDVPAGMLYISDVGQDAREEVNVSAATAAGINYGWRTMEGTACINPSSACDPAGLLMLPALEYLHSDGCSVTGGYVYRGAAIPELTGHYLYSDYCRGWLRSFRMVTGHATEHRSWAGVSVPRAVSFGRDGAGELYVIAGARVWRVVRQ